MTENGKVLSALLLGAAAGAVLGLLFAPDKGSATRKRIQEGAEDLMDQLHDKIDEAKTVISDFKGNAKDAASGLKDKILSKAEQLKADAEEEAGNARQRAKSSLS